MGEGGGVDGFGPYRFKILIFKYTLHLPERIWNIPKDLKDQSEVFSIYSKIDSEMPDQQTTFDV